MVSKKIVLHFPADKSNEPVVCKLVKDFSLEFNILRANIDYKKEGLLVLELKGKQEDYDRGIEYLYKIGISTQPLSHDIIRNENKCIQCGVCVPLCPSGALLVEENTRAVDFKGVQCIACEICLKACPQKAMELQF